MDGKRFRLIRRMLLLSQSELAIKLGFSQATLTNWENGYREIPDSVSIKMEDMKKDIQEVL